MDNENTPPMDEQGPDIDTPDTGGADIHEPDVDEPERHAKRERMSKDAMERYGMHLQSLMKNPMKAMHGLHSYGRVMHRHMKMASKRPGHLPGWFHHARALLGSMGMDSVGS